ncbi:alcohol dehydrogenase catalytic domain-containing protein [Asanoa siamensis]|uniref:alcohol dehydrogenase catalytic domain-containing protein n=1 Tax=Asanoa siamensis TaxID=926357 RepID=UPI0027E40870|nr:alcohol dehydrogenase catalytic domain-containing protein [Asanoa siamensis]
MERFTSRQMQLSAMTQLTDAYAAAERGGRVVKTRIPRRDTGPHDVRIEVAHTGVCHSDPLQIDGAWGAGIYPMVPGHEATGIVTGPAGSAAAAWSTTARTSSSPTTATTRRASRPRAPTPARSSSTRTIWYAYPTVSISPPRRRSCARASPSTRHCGTSASARA